MRRTISIVLAMTIGGALLAADSFLKTESYPRLHIQSVNAPQQQKQPLQITLELAADGKTPLALSQDQFTIQIFTDKQPVALFDGYASFAMNAPKVFTVSPNKPSTLTMSAFTNRFGRGEWWYELPPGSYTLRVYINSGKTREFDYQWLGQNFTADYKLFIK